MELGEKRQLLKDMKTRKISYYGNVMHKYSCLEKVSRKTKKKMDRGQRNGPGYRSTRMCELLKTDNDGTTFSAPPTLLD